MVNETPDFHKLATGSAWSAADWSKAWDLLADHEDRDDLWDQVITLTQYTSPAAAADGILQLLNAGARPRPTEVSKAGTRGDHMLMGRMLAAMDILGRSGVQNVEIAYDEECKGPESVMWWAEGNWNGHRVFSRHYPYPAQAMEDLLGKVLNGGTCKRCGHRTVVGIEHADYCCFMLEADDLDDESTYRYVRTCEVMGEDG